MAKLSTAILRGIDRAEFITGAAFPTKGYFLVENGKIIALDALAFAALGAISPAAAHTLLNEILDSGAKPDTVIRHINDVLYRAFPQLNERCRKYIALHPGNQTIRDQSVFKRITDLRSNDFFSACDIAVLLGKVGL